MNSTIAVRELARNFASLAQHRVTDPSKAAAVIAIIKNNHVRTLQRFEDLAREAYAINGWNTQAGKPRKGTVADSVPHTVKQCVSHIRAAYRFNLPVSEYKTYYQLRKDVKLARAKASPPSAPDPELKDVEVRHHRKPNGAAFHDLLALYLGTPIENRPVIAAGVRDLTEQLTIKLTNNEHERSLKVLKRRKVA